MKAPLPCNHLQSPSRQLSRQQHEQKSEARERSGGQKNEPSLASVTGHLFKMCSLISFFQLRQEIH
ncbi:hypothetical protein E2C01_034980 [Portunus trituberculatus]|uniref:Uncharacterized protein n=1 Tax=Portunus trituberculatus TaxID=210409 RepID=A0A5B7F1Z1_PORTR|nr:hypothetical protein [Portunus trituberculatus]